MSASVLGRCPGSEALWRDISNEGGRKRNGRTIRQQQAQRSQVGAQRHQAGHTGASRRHDRSQDGLAIAHDFPEADAERIAAMAATALGIGKRISERTNMGDLSESVIHGRNGYLVVYGAGEDTVLVMQGPIESNLGLMRIEARVAAVEIKQLLTRA